MSNHKVFPSYEKIYIDIYQYVKAAQEPIATGIMATHLLEYVVRLNGVRRWIFRFGH